MRYTYENTEVLPDCNEWQLKSKPIRSGHCACRTFPIARTDSVALVFDWSLNASTYGSLVFFVGYFQPQWSEVNKLTIGDLGPLLEDYRALVS